MYHVLFGLSALMLLKTLKKIYISFLKYTIEFSKSKFDNIGFSALRQYKKTDEHKIADKMITTTICQLRLHFCSTGGVI